MMDKFIFYSTLKVSLCSGINSIWRTCFFWIKNWNRKHFWMETWRHLCSSSSWQQLSLARLPLWTWQENSNCILYFACYGWSYYRCARMLFKNFQGGKQLINNQGLPNATVQSVFTLGSQSAVMSWKNRAVSNLHFSRTSTYILFIAWSKSTFWHGFYEWHHLSFNYTSTVFRSF